jgi:AraC-like DNA-binding protein
MTDQMIFHHAGKDPHFKVWHTLDRAMILYTYSEGGSIVCSEGSYPIRHGTLCFVGAGHYHYTMPDDPNTYDRTKLFLGSSQLRRMSTLLEQSDLLDRFADDTLVYAHIPDELHAEVEELLCHAYSALTDPRYGEATLVATLLRLFILLDRYSIQSTPSTASFMSLAVDDINQNLFSKLDIDEICAHVHVSKYHFCRAFKKKTGMTVMEYVLKTRIVMAKSMLAKERLSVTEISYRCGFSSPAYFSRVFKLDTGISPLHYRKSHAGNAS